MSVATIVFVLSLFILFYIYFGYPLLCVVIAKLKGLYSRSAIAKIPEYAAECSLPMVSIIIPAFNEESVIEDTILNKLNSRYPNDKLEVIVVSDESEDNTDAIVERLSIDSTVLIKLIRQTPRQGKTSGLNKAIEKCSGSIIVFSDANSIYDEDAIHKLVEKFNDPAVGYVTGLMMYKTSKDGTSLGCSAYMRYENFLRKYESAISSVVGVDGGVDAIRRDLFTRLKPDQLPDFVQPLSVVKQGYKVAFAQDAILIEEALDDPGKEYRMRVRVSLRAFWGLWDMKALFNPFRYGFFSVQLFSHKLLRYLAFIPQLLLFLSNAFAMQVHSLFILLLVGQVLFYCLALWGFRRTRQLKTLPMLLYIPYYFCLLNYTSLGAFVLFIRGKKIVMWKPREG